ncbi:MAG: DNA-formamidopyrimidine glycosylase [Bacillota bacterium]
MPELPEVETVKRSLEPNLIGKEITSISVNLPKLIKIPADDSKAFQEVLTGRKFTGINRRGKYLIFSMDDEWALVIHLRMTGRLLYEPQEKPVLKHTHFIFTLNDGYDLRFHDIRQFGLIYLVPLDRLDEISGLKTMGPEPLSEEFTLSCLLEALKNKKQKAKAFLLDQRCIAGIGNIYADEILFQAGIHPDETLDRLSEEQKKQMWLAIKDRLSAGVAHRGSSIKDYVDGFGESGTFQHQLKVYGKAGEPCANCGTQIERITSAGRGTAYCPKCQLKKR